MLCNKMNCVVITSIKSRSFPVKLSESKEKQLGPALLLPDLQRDVVRKFSFHSLRIVHVF